MARALGEEGHEVLEKLSTARTRIVLRERHGDAWVWVLSHDRLAEVLVRLVDEERWSGFGVDAELLASRRFVVLQSRLHAGGDVEQATAVPGGRFERIEANREVLLWTDAHRAWRQREPRGEFTLVVSGAGPSPNWDEAQVEVALHDMISGGVTSKEAIRLITDRCGWPKRKVYALAQRLKNS